MGGGARRRAGGGGPGPPVAGAEPEALPPHEKTFPSPFGSFTVGSRDETVNRIPPLNMVGTTREALVGNVTYGRIDGPAGGKLATGYHVGCAVSIGAGTLGATPEAEVGIEGAQTPIPHALVDANPVATINLNPGEVKEVAVAEKEIIPGKNVQIVTRDFHIVVNACSGPVTIRQFTYLYAKSAEVDDSGAVFGESTWL
ncbi:MspA family porin [Nocardia wallacei]|uniref:MspA family porin n=1 Tax=Nocardia wallacei TaxID=480035 RepID=UPI002454E802|nr:MspA family porin [Nocardia wallacei]